MNDYELQQLLQQQNSPQLQQGLLGGIGGGEQLELGGQNDQTLQGFLTQGQQASQQMAQNAQQQATQDVQAGQQRLQEQQMAGQQALNQQQQKRKALAGMVMSFLSMGKRLESGLGSGRGLVAKKFGGDGKMIFGNPLRGE